MGLLSKISKEAVSSIISPVTELAGKYIVDKDKQIEFESKAKILSMELESKADDSQKEVLKEAIKNNTIPTRVFSYIYLGMITFNFAVAVIIQFISSLQYTEVLVPDNLTTILLTIIGGIFGKEAVITGKNAIVDNMNKKKIETIDTSRTLIKCLNDSRTFNTIGEVAVFYKIKQLDVLAVLDTKMNDVNGLIFIKTMGE